MSESSRIMIELTSNYDELMARLIKFHQSINHAFSENLNSELFIEPLLNSLLYIFKSREAFEQIHRPIPHMPEFLKKIAFRIPDKDEAIILGDVLKNPALMPKEGIRYHLTSKSHKIQELFGPLHAFYTSVHPDIKVELRERSIEIIFTSFHAVRRNFEFTYYLVKKVLKSKNLTLADLYAEMS